MAISKSKLFDEHDIQLAELAKALAHPARIKILNILLEKNTCMCGDIVELLPLAQSTVSQHLKELKQAGFISGEVEGPKICYCLNMNMLSRAKNYFNKLFSNICNC